MMKIMNLSITKCTNNKCGVKVIGEHSVRKCPVCNSKMLKDKAQRAEGWIDQDCVILKDNRRKSDNN